MITRERLRNAIAVLALALALAVGSMGIASLDGKGNDVAAGNMFVASLDGKGNDVALWDELYIAHGSGSGAGKAN